MPEEKKISKTKLVVLGLALLAVAAAAYFKVDIVKALDDFGKTSAAIEKAVTE